LQSIAGRWRAGPSYFKKQETYYTEESISTLSRKEYLEFFKALFPLFREHAKAYVGIAFLNSDWPPARRAYALEGESFKEYQQEKKIRNRASFFQTTLTS
jgi:hypothetical protein